jgi:hypothetical protein
MTPVLFQMLSPYNESGTYLLVLFVPTGTQGLNNFTIFEVSIAVKFFTETGLLVLCSNPQPGKYPF